jgi:hypothetical protein
MQILFQNKTFCIFLGEICAVRNLAEGLLIEKALKKRPRRVVLIGTGYVASVFNFRKESVLRVGNKASEGEIESAMWLRGARR